MPLPRLIRGTGITQQSYLPKVALTDSDAQAKRVLGGRTFEVVISTILNKFLEGEGISIVTGNRQYLNALIRNRDNVEQIISYTTLPVKRRCTQTQLDDYPDSDLFALVRPHHPDNPWRLLAIISCKTSFHARETQAAFWGLSVRTSSYIKYVCVTEDHNLYRPRSPNSELGASCAEATKVRRMLESYTDRVYICKSYSGVGDAGLGQDIERKLHHLDSRNLGGPFFDDPSVAHHTAYCHLVRPVDDLIGDLARWKQEIPAAE